MQNREKSSKVAHFCHLLVFFSRICVAKAVHVTETFLKSCGGACLVEDELLLHRADPT